MKNCDQYKKAARGKSLHDVSCVLLRLLAAEFEGLPDRSIEER